MARADIVLSPVGPSPKDAPLILGLDPGKHVGVCLGRAGDSPKFDTWTLPILPSHPNYNGPALMDFVAELNGLLDKGVDEVILEAPFVAFGKVDFSPDVELVRSLLGVAEYICETRRVFISQTTIGAIRSAVVGKPPVKGKKIQKADVAQMMKLRGFSPRGPHQSDAGAVWLHWVLTRGTLTNNTAMAALYAPKLGNS